MFLFTKRKLVVILYFLNLVVFGITDESPTLIEKILIERGYTPTSQGYVPVLKEYIAFKAKYESEIDFDFDFVQVENLKEGKIIYDFVFYSKGTRKFLTQL